MGSIADGVAAGEGTEKLGARVEERLDETWQSRGETVARTEVSAAVNSSSLEDAQATVPGMLKIWICSFVNSRPWHEDADADYGSGSGIPLDEPFVVNGEDMDFPGDPSADADNVINCMCSVGYESPEEAVPAGETTRLQPRLAPEPRPAPAYRDQSIPPPPAP